MTEIIEILERINPWWNNKDFEYGIVRTKYLDKIISYINSKEIIILTGVRRAGKTTLMFQAIKHLLDNKVNPRQILFVNFDEADINNLENPIKNVIESFYNEIADKNEKAYIFFDEIQNIDKWEKYAKTIYDEKKDQLILSGSSSYLLSGNLAKLISGRYLSIYVFPLDFKEYLEFNHVIFHNKLDLISKRSEIAKLLKEFIKEGGYPRIVLEKNQNIKRELLKSYYEGIVLKDIILIHRVRQEKLIKELVYYLASNFTQLYSYKNLSNTFSADFSTIKEYLGFIEGSRSFFELPIFSYSIKTQSRNNKKIYCIDNGLRNAISLKFSEDYGKLSENLVFIELKRRDNDIYYWQNDKNQEIDFIIKNKDNSLTAINVSFTDIINERESLALLEFKKTFKMAKELIIITKNTEKKENNIKYIPLWKWLLLENRSY
ncbi:MAG: ATP-binding protein [Nanoarchaeota archaeon]|nr:ATP-binding protein [Nanoarchaeota archaeon]